MNGDDPLARQLRGFGPIGLLAIVVILAGNLLFVPLSALLVLAWAHLSLTPWPALGFVRPKSWPRTIALGILLGAVLKLVMKAVVMPLLGAPALNPHYQFLTGNAAALPAMLYLVIIGAGFGEETLYRGYMFERLERLFGSGRGAKLGAVLLTTVLFAAVHYPEQGTPGVQQAAVTGLVFGGIYARTRQLFLLMIAHAAFDVVAVALIYLGVEAEVARLFFN